MTKLTRRFFFIYFLLYYFVCTCLFTSKIGRYIIDIGSVCCTLSLTRSTRLLPSPSTDKINVKICKHGISHFSYFMQALSASCQGALLLFLSSAARCFIISFFCIIAPTNPFHFLRFKCTTVFSHRILVFLPQNPRQASIYPFLPVRLRPSTCHGLLSPPYLPDSAILLPQLSRRRPGSPCNSAGDRALFPRGYISQLVHLSSTLFSLVAWSSRSTFLPLPPSAEVLCIPFSFQRRSSFFKGSKTRFFPFRSSFFVFLSFFLLRATAQRVSFYFHF